MIAVVFICRSFTRVQFVTFLAIGRKVGTGKGKEWNDDELIVDISQLRL